MFQLTEAVRHNTAKLDETLTKVDVIIIIISSPSSSSSSSSSWSSSSSYHFSIKTKRNGGQQTEDVSHEDEVVTAGVGVHDDPPVVELVVHKDQDDGEDDADDADGEHRDVESHGDRSDIR